MIHPLKLLDGLGPKRIGILNEMGIHTIEDLVYFIPRRYIDKTKASPVAQLQPESFRYIEVEVVNTHLVFGKRPRLLIECEDSTGSIELVFFNQVEFLQKKMTPGRKLGIYGRITRYQKLQISHPEIDFLDEDRTGFDIVPLYSTSETLKKSRMEQRFFRKLLWQAFTFKKLYLPLEVPEKVHKDLGFLDIRENLFRVHFPPSMAEAMAGRKQLKLTELWPVAYQLSQDYVLSQENGRCQIFVGDLADRLIEKLPFELTSSQQSALEEIRLGLQAPHQFRGLVQGDVGSGKTLVALIAALYTIEAGGQVCLLAPTEILAKQHFAEASHYFNQLGLETALFTGGSKERERNTLFAECISGKVDLLIGTHALFNKELTFKNLQLVLIDEQHRFGVEQREALTQKGAFPDLIQLTATPIPRSLIETLYGDSKPVLIQHKPAGRKDIQTRIVPNAKREDLKKFIEKEIENQNRAYWITPRVLEDEESSLESVESVGKELAQLKCKVATLHGKMKDFEKVDVLEKFRLGSTQLLVATTVVEVGVNVPEAGIIVIEGADRFGLAQLHQLRGRVGRGNQDAWCFLLHQPEIPEETQERLQSFASTQDGFEIAERDLEIRGAGDLSGLQQSGQRPFRFFNFTEDLELVREMRKYSTHLIQSGWQDIV